MVHNIGLLCVPYNNDLESVEGIHTGCSRVLGHTPPSTRNDKLACECLLGPVSKPSAWIQSSYLFSGTVDNGRIGRCSEPDLVTFIRYRRGCIDVYTIVIIYLDTRKKMRACITCPECSNERQWRWIVEQWVTRASCKIAGKTGQTIRSEEYSIIVDIKESVLLVSC